MHLALIVAGMMSSLAADPGPRSEIVVEVHGAPNHDGMIRCLLFAAPEGFPSEPKRAIARAQAKATEASPKCRFEGVSAGKYAVSVLHDEDEDGEMDTNFLGIPSEAYGASNNKLPSASAPTFEDARFAIGPGEKKTLTVNLKS